MQDYQVPPAGTAGPEFEHQASVRWRRDDSPDQFQRHFRDASQADEFVAELADDPRVWEVTVGTRLTTRWSVRRAK